MKNTLAKLAIVGTGFDRRMIESFRDYLSKLEPSPELALIEPGHGRANLLKGLKQLARKRKPISEADIRQLEFEPDLIIKLDAEVPCLDDSFVVGAAYAEIAFSAKSAEQFTLADLKEIIDDFEKRKRNFGV